MSGSLKIDTEFTDKKISTSDHMFGRVILDKLPECIFENFEIAQVKRVERR